MSTILVVMATDAYRRYVNRDLPRRERTCRTKARYGTRREARTVANHGRRSSGGLAPYHCPYDDHWHLGHRRRRQPRDSPASP